MKSHEPTLKQLAKGRGGLVLTRDLVRAGLTDDEVRWATRDLYRVRSGAYSLVEPTDAKQRHALLARAVVLRHQHPVAASHVSAAVLHDLPLWRMPLQEVHVTGVRRVRRGHRHRAHTHEGPLGTGDVEQSKGIDVTGVARTVLDCTRLLSFEHGVIVADHALHHGLTSLGELQERWAVMPPMPGIDNVRQMLPMADGRAESVGETRTRLIVVLAGIEVEPQFVVRDSRGRFVARVDFRVKGHQVVMEFDGRGKYRLGDVEKAHWDEKRRHDAVNDAGFIVVRVTWRELDQPAAVVAKVRAAMTRAQRLGL